MIYTYTIEARGKILLLRKLVVEFLSEGNFFVS